MERECPNPSKINEIINSGRKKSPASELRGWFESPRHTLEGAKFLAEYHRLMKSEENWELVKEVADSDISMEKYEQIIRMGGKEAAFYMFMFIYQKLSGRTLQQLNKERVLLPATLFYKSIVVGDDIFDGSLEKGTGLSAEKAFNKRDRSDISKSPKDLYELGIKLVGNNNDLWTGKTNHMLGRLVATRESYIGSEAETEHLSRRGKCTLEDSILLRCQSFGNIARALTELLNGKRGYIRKDANETDETETKMFWVAMAQGMIDGRFDKKEDGNCGYKTPVLLADELDGKHGRRNGTTANRLERYFLDQVDNPEVEGILLSLGRFTPWVEKAIK